MLGLRYEAFHTGVGQVGVASLRETRLSHRRGHTPNNSTTKCGDNRALFAALKETTEQESHPLPRLDPFPIAKAGLLFRNLDVECANSVTKIHEEVCLLSEALVLWFHLVELIFSRIGFGPEGFSPAEKLGKRLLPGTDSLQAFPNVHDVLSKRRKR